MRPFPTDALTGDRPARRRMRRVGAASSVACDVSAVWAGRVAKLAAPNRWLSVQGVAPGDPRVGRRDAAIRAERKPGGESIGKAAGLAKRAWAPPG